MKILLAVGLFVSLFINAAQCATIEIQHENIVACTQICGRP